jgi:3-oxoacyl-[acyl-carrier-protein] synthase II
MTGAVVVTGAGLAVPGLVSPEDLLAETPPEGGGFDPATDLVGREMRNKDRASRLALRAVAPALRAAGLLDEAGTFQGAPDRTAVVVSSNFGTLEGLCRSVDTIAERTVTGLSPVGLPQTSSNVVAGWIAIRYGLRGPNLTVCNGGTSGLDALHWGRELIRAGRVDRSVVVGVEPAGEAVTRFLGEATKDVAAAVVLEAADLGAADLGAADRASAGEAGRPAAPRAVLGDHARAPDLATAAAVRRAEPRPVGLWLTDEPLADQHVPGTVGGLNGPADGVAGPETTLLDLQVRLGRCSGALGVLQCAAAVSYLDRGDGDTVLATAGGRDGDDAVAALLVTRTTS